LRCRGHGGVGISSWWTRSSELSLSIRGSELEGQRELVSKERRRLLTSAAFLLLSNRSLSSTPILDLDVSASFPLNTPPNGSLLVTSSSSSSSSLSALCLFNLSLILGGSGGGDSSSSSSSYSSASCRYETRGTARLETVWAWYSSGE